MKPTYNFKKEGSYQNKPRLMTQSTFLTHYNTISILHVGNHVSSGRDIAKEMFKQLEPCRGNVAAVMNQMLKPSFVLIKSSQELTVSSPWPLPPSNPPIKEKKKEIIRLHI